MTSSSASQTWCGPAACSARICWCRPVPVHRPGCWLSSAAKAEFQPLAPIELDRRRLLRGRRQGHARTCWAQGLRLDKVHNRHDDGGLGQLDSQLLHHWPEVRQELVERLLAIPDIKYLKLAIFTKAG